MNTSTSAKCMSKSRLLTISQGTRIDDRNMDVFASQFNYDLEQQLRGLLLGDAHLLLKGDLFLTSRRFPPEDLDVLRVQESFQGTDTLEAFPYREFKKRRNSDKFYQNFLTAFSLNFVF